MKLIYTAVMLFAGTFLMQGSVIETISFDLSALHAGSTLSGNFTLPDGTTAGTTVPVTLAFSDPSDYTPTSLAGTISIGSGTFLAYTVFFSVPTFTNPSGNSFDTTNNLMASGAAQCASFPCTATGRFQDNSPAAITANYTITPVVAAAAPEPRYALLLPIVALGLFLKKRILLTA